MQIWSRIKFTTLSQVDFGCEGSHQVGYSEWRTIRRSVWKTDSADTRTLYRIQGPAGWMHPKYESVSIGQRFSILDDRTVLIIITERCWRVVVDGEPVWFGRAFTGIKPDRRMPSMWWIGNMLHELLPRRCLGRLLAFVEYESQDARTQETWRYTENHLSAMRGNELSSKTIYDVRVKSWGCLTSMIVWRLLPIESVSIASLEMCVCTYALYRADPPACFRPDLHPMDGGKFDCWACRQLVGVLCIAETIS